MRKQSFYLENLKNLFLKELLLQCGLSVNNCGRKREKARFSDTHEIKNPVNQHLQGYKRARDWILQALSINFLLVKCVK